MNIIVLQHIRCETPGYIKDLMVRDGIKIHTIQLDEGEKIPDNLKKFDAMLCMGGPIDTWMIKKYPWLIQEKLKIKEFVLDLEKPFLGFCLGCQLLGEVIGGKVVKSNSPEIGILDVNLSENRNNDPLFSGFPKTIKALQWHSYEVDNIEAIGDVSILASSKSTKYQIFKYKNHAYGIQFHIEIKDNTVGEWGCVPEYKKALESSLGEGALDKLDFLANENMKKMNNLALSLYNNFINII